MRCSGDSSGASSPLSLGYQSYLAPTGALGHLHTQFTHLQCDASREYDTLGAMVLPDHALVVHGHLDAEDDSPFQHRRTQQLWRKNQIPAPVWYAPAAKTYVSKPQPAVNYTSLTPYATKTGMDQKPETMIGMPLLFTYVVVDMALFGLSFALYKGLVVWILIPLCRL